MDEPRNVKQLPNTFLGNPMEIDALLPAEWVECETTVRLAEGKPEVSKHKRTSVICCVKLRVADEQNGCASSEHGHFARDMFSSFIWRESMLQE